MSKDTFCPLPWNHLATHPDGAVSLCCKADLVDLTGFASTRYPGYKQVWRLGRVGFPAIHNSETFCQTRMDMLAGREPTACKGCYDVERTGGRSKRLTERHNWPHLTIDVAASQTDAIGQIETQYEFLELRLGNKCNLRCATCNPISSDQWVSDYEVVASTISWVDQKMTRAALTGQLNWPDVSSWVDDPKFWSELFRHSGACKKIYINGGEPMLNTGHIDYLRMLVSAGKSKNIELIYSTNVTSIPKDVMNEVWSQFKLVEINASVDEVAERNTHIRFPASWAKIERTIAELKEIPTVNLTVIQTVSAYNFLTMERFHNWTQQHRLKWWLNHVDHPDYLSVLTIPVEMRRNTLDRYRSSLPPHIANELIGRYYNTTDYLTHDKFVQFNDQLDKLRNTNWRTMFPELSEIFK